VPWSARALYDFIDGAELSRREEKIRRRNAAAKRTSFFAHILMLTAYVVFPSWEVLLQSLTTFTIPPELVKSRDSP
jgi:hypothetical protein